MMIEPINNVVTAYQGGAPDTTARTVDISTEAAQTQQVQTDAVEKKTITEDTAQKQTQEQTKNTERIKKAVENINKMNPQTEAVFGIHEATNRVTIKIIEKESKKVIKEFPPEKTLDMIAKVWEMAGILVDEER